MMIPDKKMRSPLGNARRKIKSVYCFYLLLSIPFFFPPVVLRAETFIFVGSNFPVLSEKSPDGTLRGIGIDVVRIICSRIGHTPDIRLYPWVRAQELVKRGMADVLIAPYITPERETWMDFSTTSFFKDESVLFVMPGSRISWDGNYASIQKYRIGMAPKWSVGPDFEKVRDSLSIDYARNIDLCFKKLIAGRIDMVPTQLREALAAFRRIGLQKDEYPVSLKPALAQHENYFGFSRNKRAELKTFKEGFDRELKRMNETGEIEKMLRVKYVQNGG